MKSLYFVAEQEKDGKRGAFVLKVGENTNLASKFSVYDTVQYCGTKKQAEKLADCYNSLYKVENRYLYA